LGNLVDLLELIPKAYYHLLDLAVFMLVFSLLLRGSHQLMALFFQLLRSLAETLFILDVFDLQLRDRLFEIVVFLLQYS
jgi:hypothetical protein